MFAVSENLLLEKPIKTVERLKAYSFQYSITEDSLNQFSTIQHELSALTLLDPGTSSGIYLICEIYDLDGKKNKLILAHNGGWKWNGKDFKPNPELKKCIQHLLPANYDFPFDTSEEYEDFMIERAIKYKNSE
ncbi:MAG: hypothetical protein AAFR61_25625 [Bacteroidota bacterium]